MLPSRIEAQELLFTHVTDEYQRHHGMMVGTAVEGYARKLGEDLDLWFLTGYLHDLDYQEYPDLHPGESLKWFAEWGYPADFIHAVEAHALNYNGFTTEPKTPLASALFACDEICGIFYAYSKLNPMPYGEMKASSIMKRFKDLGFAPKIKREDIKYGCEKLGVTLEEHIDNLITIFRDAKI